MIELVDTLESPRLVLSFGGDTPSIVVSHWGPDEEDNLSSDLSAELILGSAEVIVGYLYEGMAPLFRITKHECKWFVDKEFLKSSLGWTGEYLEQFND